MKTYVCIDCPMLETTDPSEARHHAQVNNHCVVEEDD